MSGLIPGLTGGPMQMEQLVVAVDQALARPDQIQYLHQVHSRLPDCFQTVDLTRIRQMAAMVPVQWRVFQNWQGTQLIMIFPWNSFRVSHHQTTNLQRSRYWLSVQTTVPVLRR